MRSITNFLGASEAFRLRTMVESSLQYFHLFIYICNSNVIEDYILITDICHGLIIYITHLIIICSQHCIIHIYLLIRFYFLEGTINNSIPLEQSQDVMVNMFY